MNKSEKPLGHRSYGTIPHLPGSRQGRDDIGANEGQHRIACIEPRDKHDLIIVQEKLDGSNCAVAKINGEIIALGRAGYRAETSPFEQHHLFAFWVKQNESRFAEILKDGERIVGEWLAQAHGTRYNLPHEPFVVFDLMIGHERLPYGQFSLRIEKSGLPPPRLIHIGEPMSIEDVLSKLEPSGHGAIDSVEGAVWRVERNKPTGKKGEKKHVVDFLVKYVRPDKIDGCYLPEQSGKEAVWNWRPE